MENACCAHGTSKNSVCGCNPVNNGEGNRNWGHRSNKGPHIIGLEGHLKDIGFNLEWDEMSLEKFEHRCDIICLKFWRFILASVLGMDCWKQKE